MSNFTQKQLAYIAARANGLKNRQAAIAAGYSPAGADVAAARLERQDAVRKAIAKAKRNHDTTTDHVGSTLGVNDTDKPRLKASYKDSLDLMRGVYNNPRMADSVRIDAAKSALPYECARVGEVGKKDKAKERAAEIARGGTGDGAKRKGKYEMKAPPGRPRLVVSN